MRPARIPRHRPGRRSRTTELPAVVAASASDPLAGNYTLIPQNDIVAAFLAPSGDDAVYTAQAFPLSGSAGSDLALNAGATLAGPTGATSSSLPVAAAVGQFTADAVSSLAMLGLDSSTNLVVTLATFDDESGSFTEVMSGVLAGNLGANVDVLVATAGYFTGGATMQLAVLYSSFGGTTELAIWDLSGSSPAFVASSFPSRVNSFALCAGDFDGDGADELALASSSVYPWDIDASIAFAIYDLSGGSLDVLLGSQTVGSAAARARFAMASGALPTASGSGITGDQLVISWLAAGNVPTVTVYPFITTSGFEVGTVVSWTGDGVSTSDALSTVATADFDLDGDDEIVVGYATSTTSYAVAVLELASGALATASSGSASLGDDASISGLALAAGPVTVPGDVSAPIGASAAVIAVRNTPSTGSNGTMTVGLLPVSTAGQLPAGFTSGGALASSTTVTVAAPVEATDDTVVLALGDFSGTSVVVGPPVATTLSSVNGLVAVMNLPPSVPNVNNFGTSVLFQTQTQQQTSLSLSVSASWSSSDTLQAKLGVAGIASINTSLTSTYGAGFTNAGFSTTLFNTQIGINAQSDDEILLSVTDYSFWEYPVYLGSPASGASPIGYLMVTWPANAAHGSWGGLDLNSYYAPDHQVGALGSYPAQQPTDIGEELFFSTVETSVGTQNNLLITSTTLTNQSASTTSNIAINQSSSISGILGNFLDGIDLGAAMQFRDTYTENAISTHQVGLMSTTVILVNVGALQAGDEDYQYTVTPILYWSSTDGHLVLDYTVSWNAGSVWATSQAPANPTFLLPWAGQSTTWAQLTRNIAFDAQADGSVNLVATIWNLGTTALAADAMTAQFYLNDIAAANAIGGALSVPAIAARSSVAVTQSWSPPSSISNSEPGYVYCVLSPASGESFATVTGLNVYPAAYFSQVSSDAATQRKDQHDRRRG